MADVSVRPARLPDVPALTAVQLTAWADSGLTGLPDAATVERAWERAVLLPPTPRHRLLVAVAGDVVVGALAVTPAGDPDLDPATASEVVLLAVDARRRGQGHGSRLLAAGIDGMRDAGDVVAVAWLPARDDATRRFLAGAGWVPDGAHRTAGVGDEPPVRWLRLATDLRVDP